jgi:two-component system NtrC family sensor kinase
MIDPLDRALYVDPKLRGETYYRELQRKNVLRLLLTYLAPLVILSGYFYFQYRSLLQESSQSHLKMAAESHATAMDLFLQERVVNLSNIIEDPKLPIPPPPAVMRELLAKLRRASDVFDDLGFVDSEGKQTAYEGPYAELRDRDYGGEHWFAALQNGSKNFIVTDRKEGFRSKSHFTLAVCRNLNGQRVMLRAVLDPRRLYLYFSSVAESSDVDLAVINSAGH